MLEVTLGIASGIMAEALKELIKNYIENRTTEQRALEIVDENALPPDVSLEPKTIVGRFASRNEGFTERVTEGIDSIDRYLDKKSPKRPLNIMLAAPPGSGKSFLVEEIVNELNKYRKRRKAN